MKKLVLAAFVAATALVPFAPAHADHGPQGLLCGFVSVTDPGTEGGNIQTGEIDGGPVLVTGDGTITCDIQVGQELSSGSNAASVSGSGNTVVYATPTVVSYESPDDVPVYLCTTVSDATGTYYWDDLTGDWVSSASAAHCSLATSASTDDGPTHELELLIDSIICPVLATLLPPEGDIAGVWDCPPYQS